MSFGRLDVMASALIGPRWLFSTGLLGKRSPLANVSGPFSASIHYRSDFSWGNDGLRHDSSRQSPQNVRQRRPFAFCIDIAGSFCRNRLDSLWLSPLQSESSIRAALHLQGITIGPYRWSPTDRPGWPSAPAPQRARGVLPPGREGARETTDRDVPGPIRATAG